MYVLGLRAPFSYYITGVSVTSLILCFLYPKIKTIFAYCPEYCIMHELSVYVRAYWFTLFAAHSLGEWGDT